MRTFVGFRRALLLLAILGFGLPACAQHAVEHLALDPHSVDGMSLGQPVDRGARWLARQGDNPA